MLLSSLKILTASGFIQWMWLVFKIMVFLFLYSSRCSYTGNVSWSWVENSWLFIFKNHHKFTTTIFFNSLFYHCPLVSRFQRNSPVIYGPISSWREIWAKFSWRGHYFRASIGMIKHHDQNQLGEEMCYFIL